MNYAIYGKENSGRSNLAIGLAKGKTETITMLHLDSDYAPFSNDVETLIIENCLPNENLVTRREHNCKSKLVDMLTHKLWKCEKKSEEPFFIKKPFVICVYEQMNEFEIDRMIDKKSIQQVFNTRTLLF